MSLSNMVSSKRRVIVAVSALILLALIIVYMILSRENSVTPQQARAQIASLVEETFARTAPEHTPVPRATDGGMGTCHDRFGGVADATNLTYSREITDIDPEMGDRMITQAQDLWREQGIQVETDNTINGVTTITGKSDGFGYRFTVNRNDRRAAMSAQTPCIAKSEWTEAGIT